MSTKVIKKDGLSKKSSVAKNKSNGTNREAAIDSIMSLTAELEVKISALVEEEHIDTNMSGKERLRLISAGVKNNGFIDNAFDFASEYPQLMPKSLNLQEMNAMEQNFEKLMHLMYLFQSFHQVSTTAFMVQADRCYRLALVIYNSLRVQAQASVPNAQELYDALRSYFNRSRRVGAEPTDKEIMRDVRSLMHGTKDGKVVIENVAPKVEEGFHKVVDEVV